MMMPVSGDHEWSDELKPVPPSKIQMSCPRSWPRPPQQILNANQQLGQYQSLEQQQLALESRSLELKEKSLDQDNAKEMADLSLKKQELDIRRRGQDIDAAKDIGVNTIRNKEAENKKDIMLQKFLLEGLGKMRDISSSQETKGFADGGSRRNQRI